MHSSQAGRPGPGDHGRGVVAHLRQAKTRRAPRSRRRWTTRRRTCRCLGFRRRAPPEAPEALRRCAAGAPSQIQCHRRGAAGWRTCGAAGATVSVATQRPSRHGTLAQRARRALPAARAAHCAPEVGGGPQLGAKDGGSALEHVAWVDKPSRRGLRSRLNLCNHDAVLSLREHDACVPHAAVGWLSRGRSAAWARGGAALRTAICHQGACGSARACAGAHPGLCRAAASRRTRATPPARMAQSQRRPAGSSRRRRRHN